MRTTALLIIGFQALGSWAQFDTPVTVFYSDVDYPYKLSTGDADGDGDTDILLGQNSNVYLFLNDGTGQFGPRTTIGGTSPNGDRVLQVADVDGDGLPDIVAGSSWYPGLGGGSFGAGLPTGAGGWDLLADVDGDGDPDLLTRAGNNLELRINDGAGNFSTGQSIGPSGTSFTSAYAHFKDVNGDALPDLVIGGTCAQIGWYANLGGGAYGPVNPIPELINSGVTHCGDVDGDGDNDILFTKFGSGTIWLANDGLGSFSAADTLTPGSTGDVAFDVDGDGDLDLAVNTGTTCQVRWWWNTGNGYGWDNVSLEDLSAYSLQGTRYALGDMDGDGEVDLVAANGKGVLMWYPNLGGSWGARRNVGAILGGGNDLSVADIDQDGDPDLVASAFYGKHITWYANNGDGTFGGQQVVATGLDSISQAHATDLDGDGYPEVLTDKPDRAILWNIGGGAGWMADTLPGQGISRFEADLDGDLDPDLVGLGAWYENDGAGNFTAHAEPLFVSGEVDVADMNGDGVVDIVIGLGAGWLVLVNDGNMGLTALNGTDYMRHYDLGDVDGDGDLDAYALSTQNKVYRLLNDGSGQLSGSLVVDLGTSGVARHMMVEDINGDGHADAVWAMSLGYTHTTYYNLNLGNGDLGPTGIVAPNNGGASDLILADLNADVVPDLVSLAHDKISWQQNHFYDAFRLRGTVFLDFDVDATLDSLEHRVPFRLVHTDENQVLVWTNSAGEYDLPADTGTWHVWHAPSPSYQVTNDPDTLQATLTPQDPIASGLDIGLAPATTDTVPRFWMTLLGPMRCNTTVGVQLNLKNEGTAVLGDVLVTFELLGDLQLSSVHPTPDSIVGSQLFWHLDSLGWFQDEVFTVWVDVGAVGTIAGLQATVSSPDLWEPLVSTFGPNVVSCAFDPNDKLVTPQGYGSAGAVPVDVSWLDYTIRFQNTGNDTAFTVTLLDTLDMDLDPVTMEVLAASHALTQIQVDTDRVALFRFQRILLPDSGTNEAASHGFVRYRIKPVAGSPHGTEITNSAGIVFDWNEAIITNTVLNTLVDCDLFAATLLDLGANLLEANAGDAYQWFLNGDTVPGATGRQFTALVSGSYTVQVTSTFGCVSLSDPYLVISTGVSVPSAFGARIHPNPVGDQLSLTTKQGLGPNAEMQLFDAQGRMVRRSRIGTLAAGASVLMDVSDLARGHYSLQLRDDGQVEVLRWAKE
ncbi:MAG: FG-GAP-like repeat-containing protein [Flavobacteriales bacterium]